jgi:hypothetical protein
MQTEIADLPQGAKNMEKVPNHNAIILRVTMVERYDKLGCLGSTTRMLPLE